jgi:hypothetical protein
MPGTRQHVDWPIVAIVALSLSITQNSPAQTKRAVVYSFDDANYWGVALQTIDRQTDPQACARFCDADPGCKVASFHDGSVSGGWANKCVLRAEVGARHPEQKGIRSWVKPSTQAGSRPPSQSPPGAAAHLAVPSAGLSGLSIASADLRSAQAPAVNVVAPAEVTKRYGESIDDAVQKLPVIRAAVGRADDGFFVPPGDLPVPNGPPSTNQVVRLGTREILLMSGCRLMNQCGTTWYVIAYDASSRTAALVEETEVAGKYLLFGAPEPALRALLLSFAAKEMHEGP